MSDVRRSAVRGLAWTGASYGLRQGVLFLVAILVARLLRPSDFGVFALASLTIAILGLLRNLGIAAALVRERELTEAKLSTAFWANALAGVALSTSLALAAPFLADWLDEPRLRMALWWLAPTFLLDTIASVHDAILERNRDYRRRALRDSAATLLGCALAVGLALSGAGLTALLAQRIAASSLSAVFLWTAVPWRPHLVVSRKALAALLAFGLPLAGWNAVAWIAGNLDSLLVGRFLGATALGLYSLAYSIARGPGQLVQAVLGTILYAELSRIQDDRPQVRAVYLSSVRHVLAVLLLPLAGMMALAPTYIPLVYGAQWMAAVPVVQLFALVAAAPILVTMSTWLYTSQGRTRLLWGTSLAYSALVVTGFAIGLRGGLVGLAVAYAVVAVLFAVPFTLLACRVVGLPAMQAARGLAVPALAWLQAAASMALVQAAWPDAAGWPGWPASAAWLRLAVAGAVGAAGYVLVLWLADPALLQSVRRLPQDLRRRKAAASDPAPASPPPGP